MKVTVRLAGLLAASAGFREKTMELPDGMTAGDLLVELAIPVGGSWTRVSVNERLRDKKTALAEGDIVFFFPVGGGG